MKGIDISMHNGSVNFNSVKASGIEVVYMKATEGINYIDPKYKEYLNSVKNSGMYFGMYHFMSEKTDPFEQAIDFWNAISNTGFTVIPALDIETNSLGRTAKEITDRCIQFLNKFKALSGIDCVIYTGGYFGRDNLDNRIKNYKGWIAHYGVAKPMETGFKTIVGHQYSDTGKVAGIYGNVDLNNFTKGVLLNRDNNTNNTGFSATVRDFQQQFNLVYGNVLIVDGIWGTNTENALKRVLLKVGSRNSLVGFVQVRVGTPLDYIYGPKTKEAVINYQKAHGLVQDGIVGYNTMKSILNQYK